MSIKSSSDAAVMGISEESLPVLPYGRQWLDEDDIASVAEVLRGDWLTQGPKIAEFEEALAEFCGARYAVAVSNGTAALHLACLVAGVAPGDTGITSPITFVASANAIAYCGGTPAFSDVDATTITMSVSALEEACERLRPKVIIPVDFSGQPADLPAIQKVAQHFGAIVIEDAAHSLGAGYEYKGHYYNAASCEHAEMAILSFHPVKHITTAEGGAILTNDERLYKALLELRSHGTTRDASRLTRNDGPWYHEQHELGFNYRITDMQCALGLSQMRKLRGFVSRRRELVELYRKLAADIEGVKLLTEVEGRTSSYHLMVAQVRGGAERRRRVFESLALQRIRSQVHYIPVHTQPWYRQNFGYKPGDFPEAEKYYAGCLSLPLFPRMADSDVTRVIDALKIALAES